MYYFRTSSASSSTSVILRISTFGTWSFQLTLRIYLKHLLWNTSIFFSSLRFIFHVSHPYMRTGLTRDLYSLVLLLIILLDQIFLSFQNTPFSFNTLLSRSSIPPPTLETVSPKYTNLSTSSISYLLSLQNLFWHKTTWVLYLLCSSMLGPLIHFHQIYLAHWIPISFTRLHHSPWGMRLRCTQGTNSMAHSSSFPVVNKV